MALKGDFDTLFVDGLLQLLCQYGKTGILTASNGVHEVKTFLKDGRIICVMGSLEDDRLGNMLKRRGLLTEEQLAESLEDAKTQQKALGKVLVEKGCVPEETVKHFIDKQAEEIIMRMLLWEAGDFEYKDEDLRGENLLMPRLNMMKILMEASRRIDEMTVFMKLIPRDTMCFKLSARRGETEALTLTDAERKILAFIDGRKSVRDIITISGEAEFAVYKRLYSLVSSGLIEVNPDRPDTSAEDRIDAIIRVYADIFQTIAAVAGEGAADFFTKCRSEGTEEGVPLLDRFHPNNPLATNAKLIKTQLKKLPEDAEKRKILLRQMNACLQCLLKELTLVLNKPTMRALLHCIEDKISLR